MKYFIPILTFVFCAFSLNTVNKYDKIFAGDYNDAKKFIKDNSDAFKTASVRYRHDFLFSNAIVFPELMRYSIISDLLETGALEVLYVNYGLDVADFSVGHFQMKPSFIESLEREIRKNKEFSVIYSDLLFKESKSNKEIRGIRVKRLKTISWQLKYLHAFISVCDLRFKNLMNLNKQQRLVLYATAYNAGFYNTPDRLIKKSSQRCFPYGEKYTGVQYSYSDVSKYYYKSNH